MSEKLYMNIHTGSYGTYKDWNYIDFVGNRTNAVDRHEVVEVEWNPETKQWEEVK